MAYGWPEGPLPEKAAHMREATRDMFDTLRDDSFEHIPESSFEVRDTPISRITGGAAGVKVYRAAIHKAVDPKGVPWHWHELGMHITYVVNGWALYEFEGVGEIRLEKGAFVYQPPFNRHRELDMSEDFEAIEFTTPGNFESVFMDYDEASQSWSERRFVV